VVNHARASSYRDRSRRKLHPNPICSGTSCHKPASAGGWSSLRRRCALHLRDIHRLAWPGPAFAKPRRLGPPHALPREGKRITPHPRCLPSTGPPPKGFALAPPALCYQSVGERRAGAFSFTARSSALTRRKTAVTRGRPETTHSRACRPIAAPQRPRRLLRSDRSAARCV
jgi:hypothetical protein